MTRVATLGIRAIGAAGELLVRCRLLKFGIDSARLTTDSGSCLAIKVKTRHRWVPAVAQDE